ncbi:hypothetical protein, partial [Gordonia sp. ABSL49_1]|uniref:hypothetical protein n=1 Tax=Gordonia sp. ABSL49_1 TaxID=2920941 RepID=UPI001F113EC7
HQVVGAAIVSFGTDFGFQRSVMHGLRGRAPGAHAAVQTAADQVNALEDALATARTAEATAHADHAASVTATAAAAATPAAPAAAAKEGQALSTLTAATAHANAVAGQLSAAWGRYTAAVGVWERLLGDGEGVHRRMEAITQTAVDVLDGQKDTPFEENP